MAENQSYERRETAIKQTFLWLGEMVIFVIIALLFMALWDSIDAPEWTGNIIDDMLYYAYDYQKFGWEAIIWRWFIVIAVFRAFIEILDAIYLYIKKQFKKPKGN